MCPRHIVRFALLPSVLFFSTVSYSQSTATPTATQTPASTPTQIMYTGKLLGYFRMPAGQTRAMVRCVEAKAASDTTLEYLPEFESRAATKFLKQRRIDKDAILVGTGDNFAPQLEAREFNPAPSQRATADGEYARENKELFYGTEDGWIRNDDKKNPELGRVISRINAGVGIIPSDNVGCFLAAARFAAVVPGKHDFYFGAERVRQLARFMAGLSRDKLPESFHLPSDYRPPQMLGANLVIKSERIDGQVTRPDLRSTPWFIPEWPKNIATVTNISDGGSVYPWLSFVHLRLMEFRHQSEVLRDLTNFSKKHKLNPDSMRDFARQFNPAPPGSKDAAYLDELTKLRARVERLFGGDVLDYPDVATRPQPRSIHVCPSTGDPNELRRPYDKDQCLKLTDGQIRIAGSSVLYDLVIPFQDRHLVEADPTVDQALQANRKDQFKSTLTPGKNYGLCLMNAEPQGNAKNRETHCIRFSVHQPFFHYPYSRPTVVTKVKDKSHYYTDPDPFVFLQANKTRPDDTVIFGIVDPHIAEQVGILNFSWLNSDKNLKTVVSAEDPAQALREQLEYFEAWYKENYKPKGEKFPGLKILLIEASPERARVFATRFPDFQVIVTAADDEQGTSQTDLSTDWNRNIPASAFVAVPIPYYNTSKQQGFVHFGRITAIPKEGLWGLTSRVIDPVAVPATKAVSQNFWQRLGEVLPQCLPDDFQSSEQPTGLERIKWLTLCAMRVDTAADVALLQKRDFFDQLPLESGDSPPDVQQILNRLIWKADLLTLLYVPGSALKKALQQSKTYQAEDSSALSLADQRWRQLEYLGIKYNAATREYLVNEVPIDDKKIYAVATSDYIGAGDTGYPDLATAALNPRTHAAGFPSKLKPISTVVCRRLYPKQAKELCNPDLVRDKYLDETYAKQTPPYKQPSFGKKLWDMFPFKWPSKDKSASSISDAMHQEVQERPIWTLSLRNFSLGFNGLTKNLSDADIAAKFSGVPTPGVTARKTSTVTAQIDTRLSRSSHSNEFFVGVGADFREQSTGDVSPQIVQINNRATGDVGVIHALRGGRSLTRVGVALYVHLEAPLQKPFSTFTLNAQDRLKITQSRNVSILPRLGLRWLNRGNSFEAGIQAGREINAFTGYRFSTNGNIALCTPSSTETFAACVNRLIKAGTVTKDSAASAITENRPRAGLYSRVSLTIPLTSKAKYVFNEEGDLFFNFHGDNAIDTRLRDISKHSLRFNIWPSLSIGPMLQILLYKNKVNGDFLFQRQFGFETSLSFDLFNRRERGVQIRHKP